MWFQCQSCGHYGEESEIINFNTPKEECPSCHSIDQLCPGLSSEEVAEFYYDSCECGGERITLGAGLIECTKCNRQEAI